MNEQKNIPEIHLHEIWKKQLFSKSLKTFSGESISILSKGDYNDNSGGPDFKNAKIRIGNLTYCGDIEIDRDYSDWKVHKHNTDAKYNSVVLHVTFGNKFSHDYVYSKDGRKIISVCIRDSIENDVLEQIKNELKESKSRTISLRCAGVQHEIEEEIIFEFIRKLGYKRFCKKSERIRERLKELAYLETLHISEPVINYDLPPEFYKKEFSLADYKIREIWEQLFYEFLFEALGYTRNKNIMLKLAKASDIKFIKNIYNSEDILILESAFFTISGLTDFHEGMDDNDLSGYSKVIKKIWGELKTKYDSIKFNETDWQFFRLRPQNFPTIRIAGGVRLVERIIKNNLIANLISIVENEDQINLIVNALKKNFIVSSDGYWRKHYIFEKATSKNINYFIGSSRADEIVINVLLPFFEVYFETFEKEKAAEKVLKIYDLFTQKQFNKIVNDVSLTINMENYTSRSIISQGIIELFREYCSKNKCGKCEIGKRIFN